MNQKKWIRFEWRLHFLSVPDAKQVMMISKKKP